MTREQEYLLWKDICTRLSYGVKFKIKYHDGIWRLFAIYEGGKIYVTGAGGYPIEVNFTDCKPYLFPLSSITKEQKQEYQYITERWMYDSSYSIGDSIDWLNAHHFDYRNLIEKGFAIDATELNIY